MSSPFKFTIPTVDRPFGFYLWDIISFLSIKFANYDPNTFTFAQDIGLPFSTTTPVLLAIVVYYVVIFGGREVMKNFEPKRLNLLFQIHNLFLTILSLTLFLLLVEQLVPILYNHGILYAICNPGSWTLLCYTQLIGHTSVSWVPIVLNLFVHVIMYWYYFLSASGIRVWWKEWVTRTQIIQFVIDLGFVYFAAYTYFASTYFPWMPNMGSCAGEEFAAIYGCGLLTSYLFLFIAFYIRVYKKSASKAAAKKAAAAAAAASAEAKGSSTAVSGGSVKSRKL